MPNIHPVISSFPLAFFSLILTLECLLLVKRSEKIESVITVLLIAGCCALIATFLSGYQAIRIAGDLSPQVEPIAGIHHATGRLALIFGLLTGMFSWIIRRALFYRRTFKGLYYICVVATFALCVLNGYRGGELVFTHGVGVTKPSFQAPTDIPELPATPIQTAPTQKESH